MKSILTQPLRPTLRDQISGIVVIEDPKEKLKQLRKLIIEEWLDKMQRTNPELCPVDMTQITYEIAASYMTTKRDARGRLLSKNSYSGIRSSIIYLFTMSKINPPPEFVTRMGTLLKGFKRTIVEQRVAAGETLEEGKEAMSFACLKLLCKKFMEEDRDEYHFAHLFLLLEWNLIARSDNVVSLHMNDFEFLGDALLVYMKKTKTDQEGNHGRVPYHCYFNSVDPHLNLGLALGLYLLTNPGVLTNPHNKLFPAEHQYARYARILNKVIESNREEFARIGVLPGTIGTHSARKGAATYAASGCTVSPSMSAICNRAGWKMGGSRDKYVKYEAAGDQFLGRVLCGLNPLLQEFALSPPFFNMEAEELNEVERLLMAFVPGGTDVSAVMFEVLRMCFACVVYHHNFLAENLPAHHRFRAHPAMTHLPEVSFLLLYWFFYLMY
mmetsp:Transcript_13416/g.25176  ORF Transcript_13416/g.25176 Transcript_13416/m.25176 type:complete len:440 (-) Transcript_13416:928-2247(-)